MRGSLHEMEIAQARKGAIAIQREKINACKSLSKGGQLYAFEALNQMKEKRLQEADETLCKAKKALQVAENKLKNAFDDKGKQGQKEEIARKKSVLDL